MMPFTNSKHEISHRIVVLGAILLTVSILPSFAYAQQAAAARKGAGDDRILYAPDGWPIHVTYYEAKKTTEPAPVVILLPGAEGREAGSMTRRVWDETAEALQRIGFAVVSVDLRKHGDSVPEGDAVPAARLNRLAAEDYQAMVLGDLEAVKNFLIEEHELKKLNIRKLGIGAAGSSALVAATFAVNDWAKAPWNDAPTPAASTPRGQDVRALLMLSPKSSVRGLNALGTMQAVSSIVPPIAVHVYYSQESRQEKKSAESLFRPVEPREEGFEEVRRLAPGPASAEGFLKLRSTSGENLMEKNIADFFNHNLKELQDPWRTRVSKLLN
ncbi:MAG: hypothetical protein R3C19_04860 [Planctomycetaceae bacterium]